MLGVRTSTYEFGGWGEESSTHSKFPSPICSRINTSGCLFRPVGMEFCPTLSTYFLNTFAHRLPSTQCFIICKTVAHIRGGVCDHEIECFLYEMDVFTKNSQYG